MHTASISKLSQCLKACEISDKNPGFPVSPKITADSATQPRVPCSVRPGHQPRVSFVISLPAGCAARAVELQKQGRGTATFGFGKKSLPWGLKATRPGHECYLGESDHRPDVPAVMGTGGNVDPPPPGRATPHQQFLGVTQADEGQSHFCGSLALVLCLRRE